MHARSSGAAGFQRGQGLPELVPARAACAGGAWRANGAWSAADEVEPKRRAEGRPNIPQAAAAGPLDPRRAPLKVAGGVGAEGVLHRRVLGDPEEPAQLVPASVDAGAHGADGAFHHLCDLLIGEPLDVAEHNGRPEFLRQVVQRLLKADVDLLREDQVARVALEVGKLHHAGQVLHRFDPGLGTASELIDVEVHDDAVEPVGEGKIAAISME